MTTGRIRKCWIEFSNSTDSFYILSHYTDAKFKNMQEISIIPDTHVLQSSIKLGLTDATTSPLEVAAVWKELLKGGTLAPVEMHPVLWNWSRNNFVPEV